MVKSAKVVSNSREGKLMLYFGQTHAALGMLNRPGKSIAEGFACDAQTGLADGHQLLETTPDRIRVPPTLPDQQGKAW
jgi:hypothetical protein